MGRKVAVERLDMKIMYDVKSERAEEFISDAEIRETMAYAEAHKDDRPLIVSILEKARLCKGLTHREAAVLLASGQQDLTEEMFALARDIKQRFYGNRIVMFAPLYLSNYCVNGCVYCPYHAKNKTILRRKLTQEEMLRIQQEYAAASQDLVEAQASDMAASWENALDVVKNYQADFYQTYVDGFDSEAAARYHLEDLTDCKIMN